MPLLFTALLLMAFWASYPPSPAVFPRDVSRDVIDVADAFAPSQGVESITKKNWRQHPKIITIRQIVSSVNTGLKKGTFKTSERKFEYCDDQYFTLRRIARDSKGVVAWYEDYSEGEDASWDFFYYYDRAGRLRFVFAFARAANGTREQLRIYLDETGKRLWKTHKLLKGWGCPGCFSAYTESDDALAFDPAKAFAKDDGCKEIKPTPTRRGRRA